MTWWLWEWEHCFGCEHDVKCCLDLSHTTTILVFEGKKFCVVEVCA